MDGNDVFPCGRCPVTCHTIEDLALHQAEHLYISLPFIQICPICDTENENLEDLLHHILDHFIEDQLQQAKLLRWMSLQNYEPDHFKSKKRSSRETFQKFEIIMPTISLHSRCLFCPKFFSSDPKMTKKILEHTLQHIIHIQSSQTIKRVALWAEKFFQLEDSNLIVKSFHDFLATHKTLDPTSNLLEKLEIFENEATNTCRLCKMKLADASALYRHYAEWHSEQPSKFYNCKICNYKDADGAMFVEHVFKKHVGCACREKFQCFEKCLEHVRTCLKNCPYCKNKFDAKSLISHLTKGQAVGNCPFCDVTMKSDQLKDHLFKSNCPSRAEVGVSCPTCRNFSFGTKEGLHNHLLYECQPWIAANSNEELRCSNGSQTTSISQIPKGNNIVVLDDIEICL